MKATVSVVGAGPSGFALAADLQSRGKGVLIYSHPTHLRHANHVKDKGYLRVTGAMEDFTNIYLTTDMSEVIAFSRYIILTVPSTAQETVLEELKHFNLRHHVIITVPGNLFSLIKDAGLEVKNIIETNMSPYSCRMERGTLVVSGKKRLISVAAWRNDPRPEFYDEIRDIFSMELQWCSSVIEVCLSNVNGVFHPLMMLMNAGRIENTGGDFFLYADGLTRSVANAMLAVDRVRMEIGARLGFSLQPAIEVSNELYGQGFTDLVDLAQNSPPHNKLKAPSDIENRNISEDVPDLLVCWYGLAEKLGIDASPITAVIILAEMATGINYMKTGRNLRKLHLENVSQNELTMRFSVRPCEVTGYESRL